MTGRPEETGSLSAAEALFADWLARKDGEDLESLCRAHPQEAAELRKLWIYWEGLHRVLEKAGLIAGPQSLADKIKGQYGSGVDPNVSLDVAEEVQPPSSALLKRLAEHTFKTSRYKLQGELARGGMGAILKVFDEDLRRHLAMKVILGRAEEASSGGTPPVDRRLLARFLEEAQVTGQLDHPGIVPVHELGLDSEGRVYFTMKLVKGRDLKQVFELVFEELEGWNETRALGVILKVCEAMAYAHKKGVVHRDLKPANVMVGNFGEVYVMDWGLARVLGRQDTHDIRLQVEGTPLTSVKTERKEERQDAPDSPLFTMDGDVVGTPAYMSPEQAQGAIESLGPRSDVYSLGAMLYHLLARQMPYAPPGLRITNRTVLSRVLEGPPTPLHEIRKDIPSELAAICEKAMARAAERRYADTIELSEDLRAFLEGRVVKAYETGAVAELRKWVVRNRSLAIAVVAAATFLVVGIGAALMLKSKADANAALRKKEAETALAKDEAVHNLARAQESEQRAKGNLVLAVQERTEADRQTKLALQNEERALRSGYAANILAADYSLKLNDMAEARAQLRATDMGLRGWEWQHLSLKVNGPLGNFSGVEALAFQPLENRAVVLTTLGRVIVKDLETLKDAGPGNIALASEILRTVRQLFSSFALDVNPDGSRLAIAGESGVLQVFDLKTGARPLGVEPAGLAGHVATTSAVSFSPDGRFLASGDDDGEIVMRDALNWEILRRLSGHVAQITGLAWSPGSERLASSSRDGTLRVWDLESGSGLGILRGHRGVVRAVAWDRLGQELFSCGEDGAVIQWDVGGGRLLRSFLGHEGPVHALDYDSNQGRLATGSSDRTVRLWDVQSGTSRILRGHEAAVREVTFDASGERVLSGDQNGTVYLWDAEGDPSTTELVLHRDAVNDLAFDPSGKRLVSASSDHELVVWNAATGEPLRRLRGHTGMVHSVVFSSDGRTILSGSQDKSAILWDAEAGTQLRLYGPFDKRIETALITPDGSRVIVATGEKKVRILDAETTEVLRELPGDQVPAEALALSPDGTLLATVGRDLVVWDLAGDLQQPLFNKESKNTSVTFSPDGKRIATSTTGGLLQLWDAHSGEWLIEQQDQIQRTHALSYSPEGKRLITASDDGLIQVRDAASCEALFVLREPRGAVLALAFSPDGARLATGTKAGTVLIYETSPSKERHALRRAASELRERARALVDELFAAHFRLEVVLHQLGETDLPQALREAALRQAHLRGDDPLPLLQRSLDECLDSEQADATYELALARATAAEGMRENVPGMPAWELKGLNDLALAAAYLRVARFQEARVLLEKEVERTIGDPEGRGVFGKREQALRLLFLCLAQCQTGQHTEAELTWRQAQQSVLTDVELSQQSDLLDLLAEVETLVRSSAPGGKG